jgi:metal-dependent amidase/aminoacylase/carboxypeptidase family protein
MKLLDHKIAAIKDELVTIRKDLHSYPELGFQEFRTAAKVANYMEKLGFEVKTGIGETGVIGLLRGKNDGFTIGLRACLDALTIQAPMSSMSLK